MFFSSCSQQASSSTDLCLSKATPIIKELASTHTFRSWPSTHQSPQARSSHCIEPMVSDTMHWRRASLFSLSQPFMIEFVLLLSILQATWSQPHTERCPTSLLHKENTVHHMTIPGVIGNHASSPLSQFTLFYHNC